jgi:hypothetical protein
MHRTSSQDVNNQLRIILIRYPEQTPMHRAIRFESCFDQPRQPTAAR